MLKEIVPERLKQTYCAMTTCTINGNPASISGWRNDFATITDRNTRMSCEFAWPTVRRIVESHREFKS